MPFGAVPLRDVPGWPVPVKYGGVSHSDAVCPVLICENRCNLWIDSEGSTDFTDRHGLASWRRAGVKRAEKGSAAEGRRIDVEERGGESTEISGRGRSGML